MTKRSPSPCVRARVGLLATALVVCVGASVSAGPASRRGPPRETALRQGVFLVATERLGDPNFASSVILILEYAPTGAMGLVVNRKTELKLGSLLPEVEALEGREVPVYFGGPVAPDQILLLVHAELPRSSKIFGDVYVTGSVETLAEALQRDPEGDGLRAYVGYAGWAPGQLDIEVRRGDWLVIPADAAVVFASKPGGVWRDLINWLTTPWAWLRGSPLARADV